MYFDVPYDLPYVNIFESVLYSSMMWRLTVVLKNDNKMQMNQIKFSRANRFLFALTNIYQLWAIHTHKYFINTYYCSVQQHNHKIVYTLYK